MITTQPLYSDIEFFRRMERGPHMPLSQSSHIHDQYETGSHLSSRTTPSSESDSRASNGSRKRVPVACERCRKRKIKCSGNDGDSQACANCKNSGQEDSCRFLRVQSLEFGHLGLQGSYTPRRYSPYSYPPYHRMNYISVASRCAPQNQLQYQPLPSSVDYGAYNNPATSVDWRPPYPGQAGSYSPYPDDEESSPYTAQPPSYMLPNTDPMSANSSYYNYGHGARSYPFAHWSEPQSFISQPASQLTGVSYALPHEPPHSVHSFGSVGNMPSNRTLPEPITARSYFPAPASSNDVPTATSGRRSHYWHDNTGSSVHQLPTPIEATPSQEYSRGRGGLPYRVQDMNYSQTSLSQGLSSRPSGAYPSINERPHSATAVPAEDVSSQQSLLSLMNPEAQKGNAETSGLSYDYAPSGTCNTSQLRSASGQPRPGPLYCQTTMLPQNEAGSDDCSPDCTSCQTESTRSSFTSITSTSSGC